MRVRSSHIVGIVFLIIVAFVIVAALLDRDRETSSTGGAAASQGPPAIRLERDTLNMGVISNTEPTTMPFTVRNVGGQPLKILSASGSCPCTWVEVENPEAPPGGSTTLHVTMDPFQIAGFESSKSVSVRSNDPARRVTVFKVICEIEPEFYIEPLSLDFGEGDQPDALAGLLASQLASLEQLIDAALRDPEFAGRLLSRQVGFADHAHAPDSITCHSF